MLSWDEAWEHPHNRARETFVELEGITQPGPSPRFSRTRPQVQGPPPAPGEHTADALADWGFDDARIEALTGAGAIR